MKNRFEVMYFTDEEWSEELGDHDIPDNTIVFVESKNAICMDVTADAKRMVPLFKALDKAVKGTKYAENYDGWFGCWAETCHEKDFIWNYNGLSDIKNGCWSYSWGIEAIDDERVYIFLNIAKPGYFEEQYKKLIEEESNETICSREQSDESNETICSQEQSDETG